MQEFLFGTWSPQIIAYSQQYPWRVFAAVLVPVVDHADGARDEPADAAVADRPLKPEQRQP